MLKNNGGHSKYRIKQTLFGLYTVIIRMFVHCTYCLIFIARYKEIRGKGWLKTFDQYCHVILKMFSRLLFQCKQICDTDQANPLHKRSDFLQLVSAGVHTVK